MHNDEGNYTGSNTLTGATAFSDNSIYAEVGLKVGTHKIARLAHRMGINTPLSTNPAMTIGGLTVGVTPLDMAHAYETIAHAGRRVSGTLADAGDPVAIQEVDAGKHTLPDGNHKDVNHVKTKAVLPASVAATETSMLETVLQYGTGKAAAIGQFAAGKTGTTSNYGDAWFVGWDSKYTVAVWVGYPDSLVPMTTAFNGGPVLGGTYPALDLARLHDLRAEHRQDAHRRSGGRKEAQVRRSRRKRDERCRKLGCAQRRLGQRRRCWRIEQRQWQIHRPERRRRQAARRSPKRPARPPKKRPRPRLPKRPHRRANRPRRPPRTSSPTGGVSPGG